VSTLQRSSPKARSEASHYPAEATGVSKHRRLRPEVCRSHVAARSVDFVVVVVVIVSGGW
jgi:hypothetical protein